MSGSPSGGPGLGLFAPLHEDWGGAVPGAARARVLCIESPTYRPFSLTPPPPRQSWRCSRDSCTHCPASPYSLTANCNWSTARAGSHVTCGQQQPSAHSTAPRLPRLYSTQLQQHSHKHMACCMVFPSRALSNAWPVSTLSPCAFLTQGLLKLLEKGDRSALPEAAPPTGLYLASVHYAGDAVFESRIQAVTDRIRLQAGSGSFGFGSRPAAGAAAAGDGASSSGALAAAGAEAEAEAVEVAAELRQTQGQKAAALMRAAAAARRAAAADAGGGGEGGAGEAGEEGLGLALVGTDGRVDYSKLKDRDDDQ